MAMQMLACDRSKPGVLRNCEDPLANLQMRASATDQVSGGKENLTEAAQLLRIHRRVLGALRVATKH
jgi:hypothetical protein